MLWEDYGYVKSTFKNMHKFEFIPVIQQKN